VKDTFTGRDIYALPENAVFKSAHTALRYQLPPPLLPPHHAGCAISLARTDFHSDVRLNVELMPTATGRCAASTNFTRAKLLSRISAVGSGALKSFFDLSVFILRQYQKMAAGAPLGYFLLLAQRCCLRSGTDDTIALARTETLYYAAASSASVTVTAA